MIAMDLVSKFIEGLGQEHLESFALFAVQALIGFIFGMSLVYMFRHHDGQWSKLLIGALVILFYISIWLLVDFTFARRTIMVFALLHILMVAFIIRNDERKRKNCESSRNDR